MALPQTLAREYSNYDKKPIFAAYVLPMTIYQRTFPANMNPDEFVTCTSDLLVITQDTTFVSLSSDARKLIRTQLDNNEAEFEFKIRLRPTFETCERILFSEENWEEWKWKILGTDVPKGIVEVSFHVLPPPPEKEPIVYAPKKERRWSFWSTSEKFSEKPAEENSGARPTLLPPTSYQPNQTPPLERKDSWAETIINGIARLAPFSAHLDPHLNGLMMQFQGGNSFEDVQRSLQDQRRRLRKERRTKEERRAAKERKADEQRTDNERASSVASCAPPRHRRRSSIFSWLNSEEHEEQPKPVDCNRYLDDQRPPFWPVATSSSAQVRYGSCMGR